MISKFINLFKKNDPDERNDFASRVLGILRKAYPGLDFKKSDDPMILLWGESKIGLANLQAKFLVSGQSDADLEAIVSEHFAGVVASRKLIEDNEFLSWSEAREKIFPQLMPIEFAGRFPAVYFPFGDEVVIGFVIDGEEAYKYVNKDDLKKFDITELDLYEAAIENIEGISDFDPEIDAPHEPNSLLAINTCDSFDAARIVSPRVRKMIGARLGFPFYFGVPNRDMLICFSSGSDEAFQMQMKRQIASDASEYPYPLSRYAFQIDEDGNIRQLDLPGGIEIAGANLN